MNYHEIVPTQALREWVRCYWFLTGDRPAPEEAGDPALPDGSPELIFHLGDRYRALRQSGWVLQPQAMLVGQITRPFVVAPTGVSDVVAVRFEPHGATAFGSHLADLTNDWLDYDPDPPSAVVALRTALEAVSGPTARAAAFDRHLPAMLASGRQPDPRVVQAVRAIRAGDGAVSLAAVAKGEAVSPRTLQRLFPRDVGVSPKLLARITRFQRVFAAWRADPSTVARVAVQCGYFDQAHLVRDFRELAGAAPAEFLARLPEFTAFFTARA